MITRLFFLLHPSCATVIVCFGSFTMSIHRVADFTIALGWPGLLPGALGKTTRRQGSHQPLPFREHAHFQPPCAGACMIQSHEPGRRACWSVASGHTGGGAAVLPLEPPGPPVTTAIQRCESSESRVVPVEVSQWWRREHDSENFKPRSSVWRECQDLR